MFFLLRSLFCIFWAAGLGTLLEVPHSKAELSDVMKLEVVTSSSGMTVHEASSSDEVFLRVSFSDGQAHGDVSLFDCLALFGEDGSQIRLTEFTGCPAFKSPMGCMVEENDSLVSPAFELSLLADHGDVNITCFWETCPAPHHPKCRNRCDFFTKRIADRGRRQSRDEHARRAGHTLSTHIRVLPSHMGHRHHHGASSGSAFGHHGHHGSGHPMQSGRPQPARTPASSGLMHQHRADGMMAAFPGPLVYLNPIICSLFLLILTVFLVLYTAFVRSLNRSVQHIKAEIERQRARDKFLVPACQE